MTEGYQAICGIGSRGLRDDSGYIGVRHERERFEITNAPDETDISLEVLIGANPQALRLEGLTTLVLGSPHSVRYEIVGWDQTNRTFLLHREGAFGSATEPRTTPESVHVSCECGSWAVPMCGYIGDETVHRRVYCGRCDATLAIIELPEVDE